MAAKALGRGRRAEQPHRLRLGPLLFQGASHLTCGGLQKLAAALQGFGLLGPLLPQHHVMGIESGHRLWLGVPG
jgi:hypothetical protein